MLFSTPLFLFAFLPLVFVLYCVVPNRLKNGCLLGCSLAFFLWGEPVFTWIILVSAVLDWLIAGQIYKESGKRVRFFLLLAAVLLNIGILVYYKYTNFVIANLNGVVEYMGFQPFSLLNIVLPIGVSFLVFEKITYVVDIYRNIGKPTKSSINYLTYIFLFPKLLAGPIVKYHEIEAQLLEHKTSIVGISEGLFRFIVGLAKKVFIADTMAEVVDVVFKLPVSEIGTGDAWLAAICFTMQIYFDFSGYSDMAIGLAKMFGFHLRENFNMPYAAHNFTDFWRRWHISLSTWIKEYVYIPLGGSRVSRILIYRNLLIAFVLSGIWHGANWTFLVWGLYHGFFLIMDRLFWSELQQRISPVINRFLTFFFVMIGWVIFRSPDMSYAVSYMQTMFFSIHEAGRFVYITNNVYFFLGLAVFMSFLPILPVYERLKKLYMAASIRFFVEYSLILVLAVVALAKVSTTTFNPFLYFRF